MPRTDLQALRKTEKDLRLESKSMLENIVKEDRDPTKEEASRLKTINAELSDLEAKLQDLGVIEHFADNDARLKAITDPRRSTRTISEYKSAGEQFTDAVREEGAFKMYVDRGCTGSSPRVQIKNLQTGTIPAQGGNLIQRERFDLVPLAWRSFRALDVFPRIPTISNAVEFPQQLARVNNAATVAENALKPESDITWAIVTETIKTIAHWIPATRQILSDFGQMEATINGELTNGLSDRIERFLFTGAGGADIEGLNNIAGLQTQAFLTDVVVTTRKALTALYGGNNSIQNREYVPQAWFMHPADWETFDLMQNNEGTYYWGGPGRMGQPVLWGVPVIQTSACPVGTAFVGDWRNFPIWDREQTEIHVSDSHADNFIRNTLVILAETRLGFKPRIPESAVKVALA